MRSTRGLLVVVVALALGALGWLAVGGGRGAEGALEGRAVREVRGEERGGALPDPGRVEPVREEASEARAEAAGPETPDAADGGRVAIPVPVEAEAEEAERALVVAVVRDAEGRALRGLAVELHGALPQGGEQELFLTSGNDAWGFEPPLSRSEAGGVTGWDGSVAIEARGPLAGKHLVVGRGDLTRLVAQPIDPGVDEQVIVLDVDGEGTGGVELRLLQPGGEPHEIEAVGARLVRLLSEDQRRFDDPDPLPSWREPRAQHVTDLGSIWRLGGLAAGRWALGVTAVGGGVALVEVDVRADTWAEVEVRLPLRDFQATGGAALDDEHPTLEPDEANGLAAYAVPGQQPRALGADGRDGFLRHTFRFVPGPEGALLELELEAAGWAGNDSVSLEYLGAEASPGWAWGARIAGLPGAPSKWTGPRHAWIQLDLSDLPGPGGERVNLLPSLADGKLDLLVQDDTIVHSARLRTR
jgi:hypothetical protein